MSGQSPQDGSYVDEIASIADIHFSLFTAHRSRAVEGENIKYQAGRNAFRNDYGTMIRYNNDKKQSNNLAILYDNNGLRDIYGGECYGATTSGKGLVLAAQSRIANEAEANASQFPAGRSPRC